MGRRKDINDIELAEKPKGKAKPEIPVVRVEGDIVRRFNKAKAEIKLQEVVLDTLRQPLLEAGQDAVFTRNVASPEKTISSVILQEEEPPEGLPAEQVMFTWSTTTGKFDMDEVKEVLNAPGYAQPQVKIDPNNYVGWAVVADFDTDIFRVDGKFDKSRFDKVKEALDKVATELGADNPLTCYKSPVAIKEAHARRWRELTYTGNVELAAVLPTTMKLEPVVPEAEKTRQ